MSKSLKLSQAEKIIKKHGLELKEEEKGKRIYRKRDELPDPMQPADAEVNRLKQQFKLRVDPVLMEQADSKAQEIGLSRQDYIAGLIKKDLGLD